MASSGDRLPAIIPQSVLKADYNQASPIFSENSRGKQCMCNCFMFLILASIGDVSSWNKVYLHKLLMAGDFLYNSIQKSNDLLLFSDLPRYIHFEERYFSVVHKKSYAGCMSSDIVTDIGISLENCLNLIFANQCGCILIFNSSAIAIYYDRMNNRYYVYDSHCRGNNGLCDPEGNCVMSTFSSFVVLCDFLRQLCMSISSHTLQTVQFEAASYSVVQCRKRPHRPNFISFSKMSLTTCGMTDSFLIEKTPVITNKARKRKHPTYSYMSSEDKNACSQQKQYYPRNTEEFSVPRADIKTSTIGSNTCSFTISHPEVLCGREQSEEMETSHYPCNTEEFSVPGADIKTSTIGSNTCSFTISHPEVLSGREQFEETETSQNLTIPENIPNAPDEVISVKDSLQESDDSDNVIRRFKDMVSVGPVYVCSCCTQTWFRENVQKADTIRSLPLAQQCLQTLISERNIEWVCSSCYRSIKNEKVPTCAAINGFRFPEKPPELNITEMEERLITPRIPFMQVMEKPRGGQRSLKGNVVNVPSDVNTTVKSLPRMLSESETIQVKLKRKTSFKHHVLYEAIRPRKCIDALKWLLQNSNMFQNEEITINENWDVSCEQSSWYGFNDENPHELNSGSKDSNSLEDANSFEEEDGWTEDVNFENRLTGNTDTLLHPADVRSLSKVFSFAPGENQSPLGLYEDVNAEYLAFPTIYCGQKRPDNKDRHTPVTYATICKWELRSQDRRAACSMPSLFFKLKRLQIKQIQDKVALAMRKCKTEGKKITVCQVLDSSSFDQLVRLNEGYRVLRTLRGSPAYWENAKRDVFAMIRQLGIPTWFCSFSAAETKWSSVLKILNKTLFNKNLTDEEIRNLSWEEKCDLIRKDPVTCARYFNHRFQIFLSHVLKGITHPLGKIKDYFYRVEFQQRGSPHIHMLIWVENAPIFEVDSVEDITTFIDEHSTCAKNEQISHLVNYQTHRHARTCKKKGKNICRFNFPLPPMPKTTILKPLEENELDKNPDVEKNYAKICEVLNEIKLDQSGCEFMNFEDFLSKMNMTKEMYEMAIRSSLKTPKVFLERKVSEMRINAYNHTLLKAWEANLDVQYILDGYACAAYIVSYISKSQRGMSNLLHDACEEARKGNLTLKQQVRQIGNKFLTHVEISAQEAAYILLQMSMRSSSRSVVFINTSEPGKRTFLLKPMEVLQDMPGESTNIESDNWIKRYQRRPRALQNCCLADFVSKFDIVLPPKEKRENINMEYLPEQEIEETNEDEDNVEKLTSNSEVMELEKEYIMGDGSILKQRKTQKVIRYVRFNRNQDAENYYREQLMLFTPWRKEIEDLLGSHSSYESKFEQKKSIISKNRKAYALDNGVADIAEDNEMDLSNESANVISEVQHTEEIDSNSEQQMCLEHGCFNPEIAGVSYDLGLDLGITRKQVEINDLVFNAMKDDEYRKLTRELNVKQKQFFYHILHSIKTDKLPMCCFLSGGAGVGKSVLTTCLYQSIVRYFSKQLADKPDEIKAVLCAPTGKAAFNINGQTIHSLFCIPANQNLRYTPLDVQQLDNMRVKFRSLKVLFIDEISMVGNKMFNFINMRLQEIFSNNQPFGGISIIAIGDLYQLKPVFDGWIFEDLLEGYGPLAQNLWWDLFRMFELTEIMRQKGDRDFADILNRLREGIHTENDMKVIEKRQICMENGQTSEFDNLPHLFTTNAEVNIHNMEAYRNASSEKKCHVSALDNVTGDVSEDIKKKILTQVSDDPSKTMGLLKDLYLVLELPAEICLNIDVVDGLTNGSPCLVKKFDFRVSDSTRCSIIWVMFENESVGAAHRSKYSHYYTASIPKTWTPIFEVSRKFSVGRYKACNVTRRQFPLRLSCAKTIHKAQGSTMKNVVLDLGKRKQEHMHYVGMSRVRCLNDLHILKLNEGKISVSPKVVEEMVRLRRQASLSLCIPNLSQINSDVKIIYHNTRSLHKHFIDLKNEENIKSADIIAISESRLKTSDRDDDYDLPGFQMFRQFL